MNEHESKLQAVCDENRGVNYNDCRQAIKSLDWDGWYPEVDVNGRLTGSLIPADQYGYSVCDVQGSSVLIHDTAMDAVVVNDAN
jgi:hypothetical protein